jgi:N-acyl-D-amino-acid deacylase
MHDLIIENAQIVDGLGNPLVEGAVAVKDGRITEIGAVSGDATETIDAGGQVLAPGVIDVHTHYDAQLSWDPTCSPSPALGVTTVVIGNCGFGIAPATPETRDTILANLSVVEAMDLDTLHKGVTWEFDTFGEYLDMLRRKGSYPNVAAYASHSTIRTVVMGDAASDREATPAEIDEMADLFRGAMAAGAFGLGSSTFDNHYGKDGVPVPSRLASDDEFRAFARVVGEFGRGSLMATCGNRTTIDFLEELAEISGRPVVYAPMLHYSNQPDRAIGISDQCAAARGRGNPVYAQASCQPLSMDFQLIAAYPMLTIEGWPQRQDARELSPLFADREFRDRVRADLAMPKGTRIFNGAWELVEFTVTGPENSDLTGRTVAAVAEARSQDPLDCMLDIGLSEGLETTFTAKMLNVDEDAVADLLRVDGNMVSLSDAGAHHTFFCDAGFGMHFLGRWVREKALFTLEEAVRKLTSELADIYGIPDRGRIAPGVWADLILFDPEDIRITKPIRVNDLPGGAPRLIRQAPGLKGVWVNGVLVFDGEDYTRPEAAPGHLLTEFSGNRPTAGMGLAA